MARQCNPTNTFDLLLDALDGASAGGGGFLPYLTLHDLRSVRTTNKQLRTMVKSFPYEGNAVRVARFLGSEKSLAAFAASFERSKVVNLSGRRDITDPFFVHFANSIRGTERVVLDDCTNLSDVAISNVRGLKHLDISCNEQITDAGIAHLVELESLVVFGTALTTVPYLPKLTELDCSFCEFADPETAFVNVENVQTIRLKGCSDEMLEAAFKCLTRATAFLL